MHAKSGKCVASLGGGMGIAMRGFDLWRER